MSVLPRVDNLRVRYGAMEALKGVTLFLDEGEIVTVLGANGAGKSTLLRSISGLVPTLDGEIRFLGAAIQRTAPYEIVHQGISHAPEGRKVFATLTVQENLNLGAFIRRDQKAEVARARDRVFLLFPVLKERRRQLAGTLSGGEQQMLAIGRALMSTPRLLLLDEPSLGLAPILVNLIFDIIREIKAQAWQFCSWSRTRTGLSNSRIEDMSWRSDGYPWTGPRQISSRAPAFGRHTWAVAPSGCRDRTLPPKVIRRIFMALDFL